MRGVTKQHGGATQGVPQPPKRAAIEAITAIMRELTGKDPGPDADLKSVMELILHGELTDLERLNAWLQLLKYTRATLKAVEHSGTVTEVKVEMTHEQIKSILAADPFTAAKPVNSETKE